MFGKGAGAGDERQVKLVHWFKRPMVTLDGDVCTVRLKIVRVDDRRPLELLGEHSPQTRTDIEKQLGNAVVASLGSAFHGDIRFVGGSAQVLVRISASNLIVTSCRDLTTSLTGLVSHLRNLILWNAMDRAYQVAVRGSWSPAPALIRILLSPPEKHVSAIQQLQKPLGVLLAGTILGSILI